MGAKRRVMNTGRGRVELEVLNRFAVKNPVSFSEVKFEEERQRMRRAKKTTFAKGYGMGADRVRAVMVEGSV